MRSTSNSIYPSEKSGSSKFYFKGADLAFLAVAIAFFPRVLEAVGAPSAINFLHFLFILFAGLLVLFKLSTALSTKILLALFVLFVIHILSALLNGGGLINVFLQFMLLAEPFILLLIYFSSHVSNEHILRLKNWLFNFAFINLAFGLFQGLILRPGNPDHVKGVFLDQGAGHVVGASISMTFAVYYFLNPSHKPFWLRSFVLLAAFIHTMVSDAKQVFLVFIISLAVLVIVKLNNITKTVQYLLLSSVFVGFLFWAADSVFPALKTWANLDVIVEGIQLKLSAFPIIISYYHNPLNWLLGLGPGHTVGRLGGWMIREYSSLLTPLGITSSRASSAVWQAVGQSWLGDKSSMWSPLFGWAGIWGDLGIIGLLSYLSLWIIVWKKLCVDDLSAFLAITIIIFGGIFTQMEEPAYMLYTFSLLTFQTPKAKVRAL